MKKITIYSTEYCPYCIRAKEFVKSKGYDFEVVDLTHDHERRQQVSEETGSMTVPMIFIGEEFIGGASELFALDSQSLLEAKIKT